MTRKEYVSETIVAITTTQNPPTWTMSRNGRKSEWTPILRLLDDAPLDSWTEVLFVSPRHLKRARGSITSMFSPKRLSRPGGRAYRIKTISKDDVLAIYKYQDAPPNGN